MLFTPGEEAEGYGGESGLWYAAERTASTVLKKPVRNEGHKHTKVAETTVHLRTIAGKIMEFFWINRLLTIFRSSNL